MFIGQCSNGQNYKYRKLPTEYLLSRTGYSLEAQKWEESAINLVKYLPANFVRDGSVDYSKELQKGININKVVLMPDFPILISGISLNNYNTLIFQKNSKLVMRPTASSSYQMIKIHNIHNVNIYFAVLTGDRMNHNGVKGEWGYGISIRDAQNIRIVRPVISSCWGDGIYIGNFDDLGNSYQTKTDSVLITEAILDNNRRNGISIIDGTNIKIENSIISNTSGTNPMSGIDIEPNNGQSRLNNIIIDKVVTFNNRNFGIIVSLTNFKNKIQKDVDIMIANCIDDASKYGMGFAFGKTRQANFINAKGEINVINPVWKNNIMGELWLPFYASKNLIKLNIKNSRVFRNGKLINSKIRPLNYIPSDRINIE